MAAKLAKTAKKWIVVLFLACSAILLFYALFQNTEASSVVFSDSGQIAYLFCKLVCILLLLAASILFYNWTEQMPQARLRFIAGILFAGILAVFVGMLLQFRVIPITDSYAMLDEGHFLADHPGAEVEPDSPHGSYFGKYSNNYFLTVFFMHFFRFLSKIGSPDIYLSLYLLNTGFLYLGILFAYLAAKEAGGMKTAVRTLFFFAINPGFYVLTFWVYSLSASIPLFTAILWLGIRCCKAKRKKACAGYAVWIGALGALAYFVRPTSMIPLIALGVMAVLAVMERKGRWKKAAVTAGMCLLLLVLFLGLIGKSIKPYFNEIADRNYPLTHWLMMASHGDGTYDVEDDRFTASFETKEEKSHATLAQMLENYRRLGVPGTLRLYLKKMCITFADGWSESDVRLAQDTRFSPLYTFLAGDRRDLFRLYCEAFRTVILLLMLLAAGKMLKADKPDFYQVFYMLTMIGGICFYFLWEAKSTYGVPFIPVMILTAEQGGVVLTQRIKGSVSGCGKKAYRRFLAAAGAVWLLAGMVFGHLFCATQITHTRYSVRGYSLQLTGYMQGMEQEDASFTQSFYAVHPFNRIDLYAEVSLDAEEDPAVYRIEVLDGQGRVLRQKQISVTAVRNNRITVEVERLEVSEEPYRIRVTKCADTASFLRFRYRQSLGLDQYEGELCINGEKRLQDALISVYDSYRAPYMRVKGYLLLAGAATLGAAALGVFFGKKLTGTEILLDSPEKIK